MADIVKFYNVANLGILNSNNLSRGGRQPFENAKDRSEVALLMTRPWDLSLGLVGVTDLSDTEKAEIMVERAEEWERIKASSDPIPCPAVSEKAVLPAATYRKAWESVFVKNGKLIEPTVSVVYSFRRALSLPFALAMVDHFRAATFGREDNREWDTRTVTLDVPCQFYKDLSDEDRMRLNANENLLKNAGARKVDVYGEFCIAERAFLLGLSENKACAEGGGFTGIKRGKIQTYYALLKLGKKFPDLDINEGVACGQYIPSAMDKMVLIRMLNEKDKDGKPAPCTFEEVEKYLRKPKESGTDRASAIDRNAVQTLANQTNNRLMAYILNGILNGTQQQMVASLLKHADACNDLFDSFNI